MRKIVKFGLLAIILSLSVNLSAYTKREFRGGWIHIVNNQIIKTLPTDSVKAMFIEALDSLYNTGCNAVIFQVRPSADAFYISGIEPWSRYLTGVQGKAPNPLWDPLQFIIDNAHARGMEVHAWCNPYRVTLSDTDTLSKDHIYYKNPNIFIKYGKQLYFNPTEPASREFTVKVIKDIVSRYDIEAVHFDDYFYPYPLPGERFNDDASFKKYAAAQGFKATHPTLKPTDADYDKVVKGDWRRYNVELLIKELNEAIKAIKPWVRFGISPFGIHRNKKDDPSGSNTNGLSNYDQLFADVPGWAEKGYIDYYVPQLYWPIGHKLADYTTLINWWNDTHKRGQLYIGQSIYSMKGQIKEKMDMVRDLPNVLGNVWWSGWALTNNSINIADSLRLNYQKELALVPEYAELDSQKPHAVKNFRKNGRVIEWEQCEKDAANPMQKALFYGVYCFPDGAKEEINNSKYLLKITNFNSYNVVEENPNHGAGCRYVVTVIDRCWNESVPSKKLWF